MARAWHRVRLVLWSRTPLPAAIGHLRWNWAKFLSELESQRVQETMAADLNALVARRKRAEGESR